MENKDMQFTCGKCKHEWLASDFDEETEQDSHDGYKCPECKSDDVSGKDLNE